MFFFFKRVEAALAGIKQKFLDVGIYFAPLGVG
jgi:hypothetical protein